MEVFNALELKKGKTAKVSPMGTIVQPVQFIPREEKDEFWHAWNIDWIEWEGLKQIRRKATRLSKNYKLANGIIDKSDYIPEAENEYTDILNTLQHSADGTALELKFYPIIPNVINTLCSEFAKRNTRTSFRAVDEYSYNELLEQKSQQVEAVLLDDARQKVIQKLIEAGIDPNDPEMAAQIQEQTSPEALKTLPEIEEYYNKTYRSSAEEWASHQQNIDSDRFNMEELETRSFRDSLITDSEFWHFRMLEDDYRVELWNPMLTFYHKSPNQRYISEGQWVGKVDMLTVADVIDNYGHLLTEEQMKNIEAKYPVRAAGYPLQGYQNDGTYYDATRPHDWNVQTPGLPYRQFTSLYNGYSDGVDIVDWITRQSEDYTGIGSTYLLRATTAYWKSQRKVGYLTRIKENGEPVTDIVDESYKVTDKPIYNNTLIRNKNKETLIFGEHIDWIWINEVRGGVKIGPNFPTYWGMTNPGGISPIYLGINSNKMGPLKFQFKGSRNVYGCKLPVEGCVYSDYNSRSTSLVDRMKPFQVGYNICNNQIADILMDELGTVVVFDQRTIPQHSLGEDWGKNNYAKAWVAMKNFSMLPLDQSQENMGGAVSHNQPPLTKLDLEQTNRLLSRINLANYFKQQAFEVVGVNAQRMGQQMGRQTATGVEENLNASYAQTEVYFTQHCDYLMPRVHQMRTDLAQHYQSTKPSLRLQYLTNKAEKINFQINGTDLLLRDINVYCTSSAVNRKLLEDLKRLAVENNTSGASIYDLGDLVMSDSVAEIHSKLRQIERKAQKEAELAHQREIEKIKAENDAVMREKMFEADRQSMEKEKDRRANIFIAEIRAAGYGAMQDIDQNKQSDYLDFLDRQQSNAEFQQTMDFENNKQENKMSLDKQKLDIAREKIANSERLKAMDVEISRVNKNRYDTKSNTKKKK